MNILSVDWDYFFPDVRQFDWGHREEAIFRDFLWGIRTAGISLETGKYALDVVHPDFDLLDGFWEKVVEGEPLFLVIVESHLDLYRLLEAWGMPCQVTNFDQHHDLGYGHGFGGEGGLPVTDCGSWAIHGIEDKLISMYKLHYPTWRKGNDEPIITGYSGFYSIDYDGPEPCYYDAVFICRSSAWTPSWADDKWLEFIHWWKKYPALWKEKQTIDYVWKEREPNMAQAKVAKEQNLAMLKELKRRP